MLEDSGGHNLGFGQSVSPIVLDGQVIVAPGGPDGAVAAYDAATGEIAWQVLDDRAAYTTPMPVELFGQRQLLVVSGERMMGLSLDAQHEVLWSFPWTTDYDVNAAQPIVVDDRRVFISAGYGHGASLVELSGEAPNIETREVWHKNTMKNKFSSSVLWQGGGLRSR